MTVTAEWSVSDEERSRIASRAAVGISVMCFAKGQRVEHRDATAAAQDAERKAYNRAKVEATTTTGARPKAETEQAYLRILSQSILDFVKSGGKNAAQTRNVAADGRLDLSASGREFMTGELAKSMLEPLLASGSTVKAIKLSTKSIGLEAAPVVTDAILNVAHCLEDADVSDIIAGRPEAEVLQVLQQVSAALSKCTKLAHLNISDNALGEKGIRACGEVLKDTKALQSLSLKNIGCSVKACAAVNELVSSSSLQLLHLFNNMSDNAGAASVAALVERNSAMKDFRMVSSRVGLEGGVSLCTAFSKAAALESFDISDNPMEPAIGAHIAALLPQHKHLKRLILNDLCLGDDGVTALATPLAHPDACPGLERVELSLNEITRASTPAVARALASKKQTLKAVVLSENELECAGAIHVAAGLQGAAVLEELHLATNMIGRVGAVAVAKACAGVAGLKVLNMDDNQISEEGVEEVQQLCPACTVEENDPDGDPEEDVLEEAQAEMGDDLELDLGKLTL